MGVDLQANRNVEIFTRSIIMTTETPILCPLQLVIDSKRLTFLERHFQAPIIDLLDTYVTWPTLEKH
jgi:hypothetical protein